MANTGTKIVLTLRERNLTTDTLTGNTKPNVPSDPDYIAPVYDVDACPIGTDFSCPTVPTIVAGLDISYEFALPLGAFTNPAIKKVKIILRNSAPADVSIHIYTDLSVNFFYGTFSGVLADTYTIDIAYLDDLDVELGRCVAAGTATVV